MHTSLTSGRLLQHIDVSHSCAMGGSAGSVFIHCFHFDVSMPSILFLPG